MNRYNLVSEEQRLQFEYVGYSFEGSKNAGKDNRLEFALKDKAVGFIVPNPGAINTDGSAVVDLEKVFLTIKSGTTTVTETVSLGALRELQKNNKLGFVPLPDNLILEKDEVFFTTPSTFEGVGKFHIYIVAQKNC